MLLLVAAVAAAGCGSTRPVLPEGLELRLVPVEGGTFQMGDVFERENTDALPVHPVEIATFRLSAYETTYAQYDAFAVATGRPLPDDDGYGRGRRAVANVSWDDALAFCRHYGYRLPTEAEWEYAAREGGREMLFAGTNMVDALDAYAHYGQEGKAHSQPVGEKEPNALGLYDMSGNVAEWVGAFYERYPEPGDKPTFKDLDAPGIRILRGGANHPSEGGPTSMDLTRTYWRAGTLNDLTTFSVGFRCAE